MPLNIRTTGSWVSATSAWFRDVSTWRNAKEIWLNVNGSWQKVFGGKSYLFSFGNTVYASTNGYLSFDNTNGMNNIANTVGRVLDYFGADMVQDAMYYAADTTYWYYRWHGHRLSAGTANECRFEIWIPTAGNYAYIYIEAFVSGMSPAATAYYVDGKNTNYSTVTTSRSAGSKYYVYFNSSTAGTAAWVPWGYDGANRVNYPWVQLPNSSLNSYNGITATDDGWAQVPTTKGSSPGVVTSLAVSSVGATGTTVSWNAPSDTGMSFITSYDYQLSTDDGVTYGTSTSVAQANTLSSATTITLGTLTTGTKYRVRVRAYNYLNSTAGSWTDTGTFSFSAPGSFTYYAYDGTSVPTKPTPSEYRGYDSSAWGNQSIIEVASSFPSDTTGYSYKAWGTGYSGTTPTSETSPAYSGNISTLGLFPDSAWTPSSTTTGGDYSFTITNTGTAAYAYYKVTANNVGNRKVTITWGASSGANSYAVKYTVSGLSGGTGATTTTTKVTGPSPATSLTITVGAQGTVAVNSVTAYDTTDCTGTNTTAGTILYSPITGFAATSITPTDKSTAGDANTVGPYKVRYYPSVTISAPTQGDGQATINWTSSNQTKYGITGNVTVATTTSTSTSATITGLTNGSSYDYTVTITSADGHTAAASNSSTQALKPVKKFTTPTVAYASGPNHQSNQESPTTGANTGTGQSWYMFESNVTISGDGDRVASMLFEIYKTNATTTLYTSGTTTIGSYYGSASNRYFLVNTGITTRYYARFKAVVHGTDGTLYTMTNWSSLA
jgi:Fibronectin type III domain